MAGEQKPGFTLASLCNRSAALLAVCSTVSSVQHSVVSDASSLPSSREHHETKRLSFTP